FAFDPSTRTTRKIKATVLALVRDLVKQPHLSGAPSILHSCAEACHAHRLTFSALLQEPNMEGHSPVYWAVIKRADDTDSQDLVAALLARRSRRTHSSRSASRACRVWTTHCSSGCGACRRSRRGRVGLADVVDEGAFVVHICIPIFQRCMCVSGEVNMEFITQGRLLALSFLVLASLYDVRGPHQRHPPSTWLVALMLLEHSPPMWIDSRLIIEEPATSRPHPKTKYAERDSSDEDEELQDELVTGFDPFSMQWSIVPPPFHCRWVHNSQQCTDCMRRSTYPRARSSSRRCRTRTGTSLRGSTRACTSHRAVPGRRAQMGASVDSDYAKILGDGQELSNGAPHQETTAST
ncbi:hypothetical protein B0H21DRAFT_871532, partial [Amylocystis lapponica]